VIFGSRWPDWLYGWGGLLVSVLLGLAGALGLLLFFYRPPVKQSR
jgi:putative oxidoreductase